MRKAAVVLLTLAACGLAGPARAQTMSFDANDAAGTYDCTGRQVSVLGNRNELHLTGGCAGLSVAGNRNRVEAAMAPGAPISVPGNDNAVRWSAAGPGAAPGVSDLGNRNRVEAGAPSPSGSADVAAAPPPGPGVTIDAGGIHAPGVEIGPDGIRVPGAAVGPGGVRTGDAGPSGAGPVSTVATPRGTLVNITDAVLFDVDSDALRPAAADALDQVAALVARDRPRAVEVVGHADATGAAAHNDALSRRRAAAVADWLRAHGGPGFPPLSVAGRGAREPVATNATPEGRAQNRRVVLLLAR